MVWLIGSLTTKFAIEKWLDYSINISAPGNHEPSFFLLISICLLQVEGPVARDVLENFIERWNRQALKEGPPPAVDDRLSILFFAQPFPRIQSTFL